MRRATLLGGTGIDDSTETTVDALVSRLNGLFQAKAVLTRDDVPTPSVEDISATADALEAGVSETALLQIQRISRGDCRVLATEVLMKLVQLGHVPEDAVAQVHTALSGGAEALANVRSKSQRSIAGSVSVADVSRSGLVLARAPGHGRPPVRLPGDSLHRPTP